MKLKLRNIIFYRRNDDAELMLKVLQNSLMPQEM